MPEIGYRYDVHEDELNELIEKANFINPIAILEKRFCLEGKKPAFFDFFCNLEEMVFDWDKGRVFDPNSEIRWEQNGNNFHLLWTTHSDNIPDEWSKKPVTFKAKRKVLLWGERVENENEWYEKQIPRILKYPVEGGGQRAYLNIIEYAMPDGSPVYRFKELTTE